MCRELNAGLAREPVQLWLLNTALFRLNIFDLGPSFIVSRIVW